MDNGYRGGVAGGGVYMLCRGQRCAVLSVSAEYTIVDVSEVPDAAVGDLVTVIGRDGDEEISVESLAQHVGAPSAARTGWSAWKSVPYRYTCSDAG